MSTESIYPAGGPARDNWIVARRGPRNAVDASRPYAFFIEDERLDSGDVGPVATIFLTNRECPWRCAMCDLWKNTTTETVPVGSIPRQIEFALKQLPAARQVKLYNSGSFFDPRAVPLEDYAAIAALVKTFERVIVECHPSLVCEDCYQFEAMLETKLEVAMGLETVHPFVLEKLNKRMTLDAYLDAAQRLSAHGIDLRSFILVQPPFMVPKESLDWACRSIDFAMLCRATSITLIPTRAGNGAMDALALAGEFVPPELSTIEAAQDYGISFQSARVCVDLWDIELIQCEECCREDRLKRIRKMNLSQCFSERVQCRHTE